MTAGKCPTRGRHGAGTAIVKSDLPPGRQREIHVATYALRDLSTPMLDLAGRASLLTRERQSPSSSRAARGRCCSPCAPTVPRRRGLGQARDLLSRARNRHSTMASRPPVHRPDMDGGCGGASARPTEDRSVRLVDDDAALFAPPTVGPLWRQVRRSCAHLATPRASRAQSCGPSST